MREVLLLTIFGLLSASSFKPLITVSGSAYQDQVSSEAEVLYLPDKRAVELLSFGYRNALADYLWFKTISYFGKHYERDRDYQWMAHMCDLVTELNPLADHVYLFCGSMLSWEAKNYKGAVQILSKAIEANPANWIYYYYRGFNYMYFLNDNEKARDDFIAAAKLPNAHPLVQRLAAKKISMLNNPETAIEFLTDMVKKTEDPKARDALIEKLKELRRKNDIALLTKGVEMFTEREGRRPNSLKDLIDAGIVTALPPSPSGAPYSYNRKENRVEVAR